MWKNKFNCNKYQDVCFIVLPAPAVLQILNPVLYPKKKSYLGPKSKHWSGKHSTCIVLLGIFPQPLRRSHSVSHLSLALSGIQRQWIVTNRHRQIPRTYISSSHRSVQVMCPRLVGPSTSQSVCRLPSSLPPPEQHTNPPFFSCGRLPNLTYLTSH
jgi:hypothetical protein